MESKRGGKENQVGPQPSQLTERRRHVTSMADHLAMIKDQAEGIGEYADHGQHDQGASSMHGGLLEMSLNGEGLERFGIHAPAAAAELEDKGRKVRPQVEVAGTVIRAFWRIGSFVFFIFGFAVELCPARILTR